MLFTAAELYGAMAQCSSRAKMGQHAARTQVQMCRHLIARRVDDKNDRFALLDTARTLKDYVGKAMTGLVGDGIAYLQMVRDAYRWIDHFENHTAHGKPPTTRSPDYVFSRTGDLFVALTESKATKGASRAAFTKTVRDGYHEQVEPYLGRKIGTWIASHGYAVGSWMKSVKKAEIFIDHTASSGSSSGKATTLQKSLIRRACGSAAIAASSLSCSGLILERQRAIAAGDLPSRPSPPLTGLTGHGLLEKTPSGSRWSSLAKST